MFRRRFKQWKVNMMFALRYLIIWLVYETEPFYGFIQYNFKTRGNGEESWKCWRWSCCLKVSRFLKSKWNLLFLSQIKIDFVAWKHWKTGGETLQVNFGTCCSLYQVETFINLDTKLKLFTELINFDIFENLLIDKLWNIWKIFENIWKLN